MTEAIPPTPNPEAETGHESIPEAVAREMGDRAVGAVCPHCFKVTLAPVPDGGGNPDSLHNYEYRDGVNMSKDQHQVFNDKEFRVKLAEAKDAKIISVDEPCEHVVITVSDLEGEKSQETILIPPSLTCVFDKDFRLVTGKDVDRLYSSAKQLSRLLEEYIEKVNDLVFDAPNRLHPWDSSGAIMVKQLRSRVRAASLLNAEIRAVRLYAAGIMKKYRAGGGYRWIIDNPMG